MRTLLAGNWKMNGLRTALAEIRALGCALAESPPAGDVVICPPATLVAEAVRAAQGTCIAIGGQDCHSKAAGAFTGDVSAEMLRDAGATFVILGHSERRQVHGENDAGVAEKTLAAKRAGLSAIVCVGETEAQRNASRAVCVVVGQLAASIPEGIAPGDFAVAYEPIWAIGTGRTPTTVEIEEMHSAMRAALTERFGHEGAGIRLLYGGSVKPDNAAGIFAVPDVEGALIGGASMKAVDFLAIVRGGSKG